MGSPLAFCVDLAVAGLTLVSMVFGLSLGRLNGENGTVEIASQPVRFALDYALRAVVIVYFLFAAAHQVGLAEDPIKIVNATFFGIEDPVFRSP